MALAAPWKQVGVGLDGEASGAARLAAGRHGARGHSPGDTVARGEGARLTVGGRRACDPGGCFAIAGWLLTDLRVVMASTTKGLA